MAQVVSASNHSAGLLVYRPRASYRRFGPKHQPTVPAVPAPQHLALVNHLTSHCHHGPQPQGYKHWWSAFPLGPAALGGGTSIRHGGRSFSVRTSGASSSSVQTKGCTFGAESVIGTGRQRMEDVFIAEPASTSDPTAFFAVFDGHGGVTVAHYLREYFWGTYLDALETTSDLEAATVATYLKLDKAITSVPDGFWGQFQQRGIADPKCGATGATVLLLPTKGGGITLVAGNVGDSRVLLLGPGDSVTQLTVDHTPDLESERKRIEAKNPTPKKPLVVNVNGTWRVGGILALSRSFGDVFLKDWSDGKDASGGFGLIAEPDVVVEQLTQEDTWLVLGTDGLFEKLSNEEVASFVRKGSSSSSLTHLASSLAKEAQQRGATDDVTVVLVPLK